MCSTRDSVRPRLVPDRKRPSVPDSMAESFREGLRLGVAATVDQAVSSSRLVGAPEDITCQYREPKYFSGWLGVSAGKSSKGVEGDGDGESV